jgi:microcystin-dependent protein
MADPVTSNIGLAIPTRGTDIGAWDTPVNNNASVLDLCLGGTMIIGLNNSNVVLSAAQYQCKTIVFNSTLTGSVTITFPTSFTKSYEILNGCTGSSAFTVTLQTTATGGTAICAPPNEYVDVINDATNNMRFKNFGRIGSYWDHAGSSVPAWVSGCTVPPYLNCDGSGFSAATYPVLATYIGGTTLPDLRGRVRAYLNQGTGRMGAGGVNGNVLFASGAADTWTITTSNVPALAFAGTAQNWNTNSLRVVSNLTFSGVQPGGTDMALTDTSVANVTVTPAGTVNNGSPNSAISTTQPSAIGGITMIRAG